MVIPRVLESSWNPTVCLFVFTKFLKLSQKLIKTKTVDNKKSLLLPLQSIPTQRRLRRTLPSPEYLSHRLKLLFETTLLCPTGKLNPPLHTSQGDYFSLSLMGFLFRYLEPLYVHQNQTALMAGLMAVLHTVIILIPRIGMADK